MIDYNKYTIYYLSSLPTKDNLKTAWIAANAGGKKGGSSPDPGPGPGPTPGPDDPTFPYDVKIDMPTSGELDFLYTADIHNAWRNFGLYKGTSGKGNAKTGVVSVFSLGSNGGTGSGGEGDVKYNLRKTGVYASDADFKGDLPGDLATYQKKLIDANIPTYLLDAGDFSQTNGGETLAEKRYCIQRMKELNYFAIAIGNHEWNWPANGTWSASGAIDSWGGLNIVCCNLFHKEGGTWKQIFKPYKTIKVGTKKIAVIGIACPNFYCDNKPDAPSGKITNYFTKSNPINSKYNVGWWYYERWSSAADDWVKSTNYIMLDSINNVSQQSSGTATNSSLYVMVQDYINDLKNNYGFDYIIALFHMTDSGSQPYDTYGTDGFTKADYLIKNTSGLDVVIPGHYNKSLYPSVTVAPEGGYQSKIVKDKSGRNVMIAAEPGGMMKDIGRLRINLNTNQITCKLLSKIEDLNNIN